MTSNQTKWGAHTLIVSYRSLSETGGVDREALRGYVKLRRIAGLRIPQAPEPRLTKHARSLVEQSHNTLCTAAEYKRSKPDRRSIRALLSQRRGNKAHALTHPHRAHAFRGQQPRQRKHVLETGTKKSRGRKQNFQVIFMMHFIYFFLHVALAFHEVYMQYYSIDQELNWSEAQQYCREHYTDLATVSSMEDLMRMKTLKSDTWIGKFDDPASWQGVMGNDSNSWRWSATGNTSPGGYQNWKSNEPNNYLSNNYCVHITNGLWADAGCQHTIAFACFTGSTGGSKEFILVTAVKTWEEARSYCREHYTDLAVIEDAAENSAVAALNPSSNVWIGLYREAWRWSDGSTSTFTNWATMERKRIHVMKMKNQAAVDLSDSSISTLNQIQSYLLNMGLTDLKQVSSPCVRLCACLCMWSEQASPLGSGARALQSERKSDSSDEQKLFQPCAGSVSCFHTTFYKYHFINTRLNWTDAQQYCRQYYTDLATFWSLEDVNRVERPSSYGSVAWIGLFDDVNSWQGIMGNDSNSWRWSVTGNTSPGGYESWRSDRPYYYAEYDSV
ncbi:hypothetical protein WMY93_027026 [Mugilogobius chulae]|uniref:C-type lectin domain-containing protein n=1 Tax=Mugilogobius chulae TaxID=88201 RepID=A0AAW0MWF8_9GOBI